MEPLQSVSMPTHGVIIAINTQNSWPSTVAGDTIRMAYIASNSADQLSFVSLRSATRATHVLSIAVAPAGATTYYPPQQIDDTQ